MRQGIGSQVLGARSIAGALGGIVGLGHELRALIGVASRLDARDAGNRDDDGSAGESSDQETTVDAMAALLLFLCNLGLEVVTCDFDGIHQRCAPVYAMVTRSWSRPTLATSTALSKRRSVT